MSQQPKASWGKTLVRLVFIGLVVAGLIYALKVLGIQEKLREMLAWMSPIGGRHTLTHTLLDKFFRRRFRYDTDLNGSHRAIIPIGSWEEVNPLDILPTALVKSLSSGDLEEAEKLGALELVEEDVALWEYVCPSKSPVTTWLRRTLDQIEKEG